MTIQTFNISNNPTSIQNAIAQCLAALTDLGCFGTIKYNKKSIRITSEQLTKNLQTGEYFLISFLLKLK